MKKILKWLSSIPKDKLLHFIVGILVGAGCMRVFSLFLSLLPTGVLSCLVLGLVGIGKEWYDTKHGGTVDYVDILYTIVGGLVGIEIAFLFLTL